MATRTCKTCQLAIPAGTPTCPYCGGKTGYVGNPLYLALGVLAFIAALAYVIATSPTNHR
jgi:hypothetical protein